MPFIKNKLYYFKFTMKFVESVVLEQYIKKLNAFLRRNIILSIYKLYVLLILMYVSFNIMIYIEHILLDYCTSLV